MDCPPKTTLSRYNKRNCTVGTSTRCTPGSSCSPNTASIPISLRKTKNSSSSPASLNSCSSSISSPAYSPWATSTSSRTAHCQLKPAIPALGSFSSFASSALRLLISSPVFPLPYHFLLLYAILFLYQNIRDWYFPLDICVTLL